MCRSKTSPARLSPSRCGLISLTPKVMLLSLPSCFLFVLFVVVCVKRQLKELLPSFDLGFMEGDEFREFYKFAFQFSREGTHRTIERDVAAPLLQVVSRCCLREVFNGFVCYRSRASAFFFAQGSDVQVW